MATVTRGGALNGIIVHTQRMVMEQNAQLLRTKNEKLEKLCRALQAERNQLRKQEKTVWPIDVIYASSLIFLSCRMEAVAVVETSQETRIKVKKRVLERRRLVERYS